MKIGFIGLGIMGKPMAKNLMKAGYEIVTVRRDSDSVREIVGQGAVALETPKAVAAECDVVLTMLPNSPDVAEVAVGENGIIEGAHEGLVFVDMSSIDPLVAREVSEKLAAKGVTMVDAPVSGGEPMAIEGTLSFMVGGPEDAFENVKPILDVMGKSVVRVGDIGAGNTAKLVNQAIVAVNIGVLAEGLVLAQKAGVSPEAVFHAIKGGLAGSTVMNAKAPMMLEHNFKPGFRIGLHLKDLNNVMSASHAMGAPMPLTAQAFEGMTSLRAKGFEGEDHSALLRVAEAAANTELTNGDE